MLIGTTVMQEKQRRSTWGRAKTAILNISKKEEKFGSMTHMVWPNDRSPAFLILPCLVISTLVLQFGFRPSNNEIQCYIQQLSKRYLATLPRRRRRSQRTGGPRRPVTPTSSYLLICFSLIILSQFNKQTPLPNATSSLSCRCHRESTWKPQSTALQHQELANI